MIRCSRPAWRATVIATAVLAGVATLPAIPAAAHPKPPGHEPRSPEVVATGLQNPRLLSWSRGALYVAEAGVGGSGPCITGAEDQQTCYGASGAITRVTARRQTRVVRGLPSLAPAGGAQAAGPSDVRVHGRHYEVVLGLGSNPANRASLPARGRKLGTLSVGRFGSRALYVKADISGYEASANPDGKQIDSNPVALLERRRHRLVVDAGGNDVVSVRHGRIRTVVVFPTTDVPAPPGIPGLPPRVPMDAVPTAAVTGSDGAIYVSQLTGFPFPVGGASIWRVVPGQAPTKYATGLTNVTDLAFGRDGSLYAVQIATKGLLAGPVGSVVRIPRGGGAQFTTVAENLASPYGIALRGGSAYVTTCSVCPGQGEVVRISLPRH